MVSKRASWVGDMAPGKTPYRFFLGILILPSRGLTRPPRLSSRNTIRPYSWLGNTNHQTLTALTCGALDTPAQVLAATVVPAYLLASHSSRSPNDARAW